MHAPRSFGATLRSLWFRVTMLALIAVVLSHAVAPIAAPMERVKGSAFSASTADVSLLTPAIAVTKAAHPRAVAALPVPALVAALFPIPTAAARPANDWHEPGQRGPPDRARLTDISPIGPPAR